MYISYIVYVYIVLVCNVYMCKWIIQFGMPDNDIGVTTDLSHELGLV